MPSILNFPALPHDAATSIEAAGQVTGSTDLTGVSCPGTANQWSSWSQFIASTSKRAIAGFICAYTTTGCAWNVELGVGPSTSEVTQVRWASETLANSGEIHRYSPVFLCAIPAGSRITIRVRCNSASGPTIYVGIWLVEVG